MRGTPDAQVVDLACGTGATTEALLSVLGTSGRVVAVDASAAMLAAARAAVKDERVRWLRLAAERLDTGVGGAVDTVVCNSAIWQTDVRATVMAVGRVLHPGGAFVFNVCAEMLADHVDPGHSSDPLIELMEEFAAREYGWVAAPDRTTSPARQDLSEGGLCHVLSNAEFEVNKCEYLPTGAVLRSSGPGWRYPSSPSARLAACPMSSEWQRWATPTSALRIAGATRSKSWNGPFHPAIPPLRLYGRLGRRAGFFRVGRWRARSRPSINWSPALSAARQHGLRRSRLAEAGGDDQDLVHAYLPPDCQ
ncbi:MAG TPA: class I SAM-dependent methyltransferase [Streptosporangiaceae bacterium]